jgi:hypothetical protein
MSPTGSSGGGQALTRCGGRGRRRHSCDIWIEFSLYEKLIGDPSLRVPQDGAAQVVLDFRNDHR